MYRDILLRRKKDNTACSNIKYTTKHMIPPYPSKLVLNFEIVEYNLASIQKKTS